MEERGDSSREGRPRARVPLPLFCLAIFSGPNAKDSVEECEILVDDNALALRWKEPRDRSYYFPYSY